MVQGTHAEYKTSLEVAHNLNVSASGANHRTLMALCHNWVSTGLDGVAQAKIVVWIFHNKCMFNALNDGGRIIKLFVRASSLHFATQNC